MPRRSSAVRTLCGSFFIGGIIVAAPVLQAAVSEPTPDVTSPHLGSPSPPTPADERRPAAGSRGQLLYENHCTQCHASVVHVREDRRARSLKELESWVMRWVGVLQLGWGASDIAEVVEYLNRRYYKVTPNGAEK